MAAISRTGRAITPEYVAKLRRAKNRAYNKVEIVATKLASVESLIFQLQQGIECHPPFQTLPENEKKLARQLLSRRLIPFRDSRIEFICEKVVTQAIYNQRLAKYQNCKNILRNATRI